MHDSIDQPYVSDALNQLILAGDYKGFMSHVNELDRSDPSWEHLQIRGLRVLVEQGLSSLALEKARFLKEDLSHPGLDQSAHLIFNYLDWLFNGRSQEQLVKAESSCKESMGQLWSSLLGREIRLRIEATKLMLGMVHYERKQEIVDEYRELVHTYMDGDGHAAFCCLLHMVKLLLSRPLKNREQAVKEIESFLSEPFIKGSSFRLGVLYLVLAEIHLELYLDRNRENSSEYYFSQALQLFRECDHPTGPFRVMASRGRILLKYGIADGRTLMDKALRGFERHKDFVRARSTANHVMQWLQKTGTSTGVHTYKLRMVDYEEEGIVSHERKSILSTEGDLAIRTHSLISNARWIRESGNSPKALKALKAFQAEMSLAGDSVLKAELFANMGLAMDTESKADAAVFVDKAVHLYQVMGYPQMGLSLVHDLLTQRSVRINQLKSSVTEAEVYGLLGIAERFRGSEQRMDFYEKLACVYELGADLFRQLGQLTNALDLLGKARKVYHKCGLRPRLAHNLMYTGFFQLELGRADNHLPGMISIEMAFRKALGLFKALNYQEGIWRCELGLAITHYGSDSPLSNLESATHLDRTIEAFGFLRTQQKNFAGGNHNCINDLLADNESLKLFMSSLFNQN